MLRGAGNVQKHTSQTFPPKFPGGQLLGLTFGHKTPSFCHYLGSNSVNYGINRHHCTLTNPLVQFLLLHCPFCCPTHQTLSVSVHKSPGTVEESPDHIYRAFVKALTHGLLCVIKPFLVNFPVLSFTPPPVL